MVELTGTTPSEAGGNGQGGTTDFSSQLDAATLSAVSDPMAQQGGIEKLAPYVDPRTADIKSKGAAIAAEIVSQFPGRLAITLRQAQCLVQIYGYTGELSAPAIIQRMKDDGIVYHDPLPDGTPGWFNLYLMSGDLVSDALCRAVGKDTGTALTAAQFDNAIAQLFGDIEGVSPLNAGFIVRCFGSNGTLSSKQVAGLIDNHFVWISFQEGHEYTDFTLPFLDTMSAGQLAADFARRGQTVTPEQAQFLINVYGNGTLVLPANVQQMRDDGFMTGGVVGDHNDVLGQSLTLNWNKIDGVLMARAIFVKAGVDSYAAGAAGTVTADQFNNGFNSLCSGVPVQALSDAAGLTKVFGTKGTLTVTQMSVLLNGLNAYFDIPSIADPGADGRILTRLRPGFEATSWWDSVLKFAGDEAKNVVSTISDIAGVGEDIVAGILNGKIPAGVALAKGGYKIITAISDAIKKGDESAKNLMTTMGSSLKSLVSTVGNEVKVLSQEGQALVDQLVVAAKEGATEIEIRALTVLSGMSAEAARAEIESMAFKSKLTNFAKDMSYDNMKTLIPNYDDTLADLTKAYDSAVASFGNSDADRMLLAEKGYKFDSDNNLTKEGRVLSNIEKLDVFGDRCRADIGVELGVAMTGLGFPGIVKDLDAYEARMIYSYAGKDANGNAKHQLRFRIGDLAGVALPTRPVTAGAGVKGDSGLFTNHDILLSWAVAPDGSSTKNDVLYNSSIGMVLEGSGPAYPVDYIPGPVGDALDDVGLAVPVSVTPSNWTPSVDVEMGVGWSATVSYNLSKMGNFGLIPFVSEITGAAIATAASSAALANVEIETLGGATPFLALFGETIIHASAMLGAFSADLLYTLGDYLAGTANVTLSFGVFCFVSPRLGVENAWVDGDNGFSIAARLRGQISAGSSGDNLY